MLGRPAARRQGGQREIPGPAGPIYQYGSERDIIHPEAPGRMRLGGRSDPAEP